MDMFDILPYAQSEFLWIRESEMALGIRLQAHLQYLNMNTFRLWL